MRKQATKNNSLEGIMRNVQCNWMFQIQINSIKCTVHIRQSIFMSDNSKKIII